MRVGDGECGVCMSVCDCVCGCRVCDCDFVEKTERVSECVTVSLNENERVCG